MVLHKTHQLYPSRLVTQFSFFLVKLPIWKELDVDVVVFFLVLVTSQIYSRLRHEDRSSDHYINCSWHFHSQTTSVCSYVNTQWDVGTRKENFCLKLRTFWKWTLHNLLFYKPILLKNVIFTNLSNSTKQPIIGHCLEIKWKWSPLQPY